MIHSIKSDKESFKTITFKAGLNIVLAERMETSAKKESRNGLGKSTILEIIHFCLGGKKGTTLSKEQLDDWSFTLELDLLGKRYSITRNTKSQTKIFIDGDCAGWPIKPELDDETGQQVLSVKNLNLVLGALMFGLELSYSENFKYVPKFRSLISYFLRRGEDGGYLSPFQHYKKQNLWDDQLHNAFLLGLDWKYISKLQVLKDRMKVFTQIKEESESGILSNIMGSIGELEALKFRLENQIELEDRQLETFEVHPQYREIEIKANELTNEIHNLVNSNIVDVRLLEHYELSLVEEKKVENDSVIRLYQEAGIVLPEMVKKRIEDVITFHSQVISNRKDFLAIEISRLKKVITVRKQKIEELSGLRAGHMQVLKKHKALDEYAQMQDAHQKTVVGLEHVGFKLENMRKFEQGKSSVAIDQEVLQQQARIDLDERNVQRKMAISIFNSNSQELYEAPGILSIDVNKTGYQFNVKIERKGSHGIQNMEIFCYDLMIAELWAKKDKSPKFLFHDSIIFADVDERQRALALELVANQSEKLGYQYICTLNSDNIPTRDFSSGFNIDKFIRLKLTDANDDDGLLGIRF